MRYLMAFPLLIGMMCGGVAIAQETGGEIVGTVRSEDGQALPGATVILENQATGFRRAGGTRADGSYRLMALQPASYVLTVGLDGFQTYRRAIQVGLGSALTNDVRLKVGAFSDVVEVTGEVPLVDMTSAVSGITVDTQETFGSVPIPLDVTRVSLLAPGTVPGGAAFERGASRRQQANTPGQRLVSFNGASINENVYVVNGLNITSLRELMGSSFVPMEFVQEAQVKTGGYEAEFGRSTGGVVNLVTKSGSNTLRGAASAYWEPRALQENELDVLDRDYDGGVSVARYNRDEEQQEIEGNLSLGGPLIKDRLFFFSFVRYSDTDRLDVWSTVAQRVNASAPYWGGKIDWLVTPSHRFEGTVLSDETEGRVTGFNFDQETRTLADVIDTGTEYRGGLNSILKYSGLFTDNLLISAQLGRNEFNRTDLPDGADVCPQAHDQRSGTRIRIGCWLDSTVGTDDDERTAYRLDLDWYVGRHSLRVGVDFESNQSTRDRYNSGGVSYRYYLNGDRFEVLPAEIELVRVRHETDVGTYEASSSAAYIQDSWAVTPRLTVNYGVRWEGYENRNVLGQRFIQVDDQFAPRLGVVWNVRGDGRSKLYGSFGVYHLPMSTEASMFLGSSDFEDNAWYVLEGGINPDGSPEGLGEQLSYQVLQDGLAADPLETHDSSFEPMSQHELILGFERRVGSDWSLGVRGVARRFHQVIEDILIDKAMWEIYGVPCFDPAILDTRASCAHDYRLTNPGSDFSGWYDLDGDGVLDPIFLPAEVIGVPKAKRDYYAVELSFRRRFTGRWMLQGSYTWSHSYGNYEGMVNSEFTQVNPYFTKTFDVAAMTEHSWGDLPNDRRHNVKLFGMFAWDSGFQVGGNFHYQSGRPVNGLGMHPTDPWAQWYGNFSFYNNGEPCPRGCAGRMPATWTLDTMLRYDFQLAGLDWFARVDAFNVFNNDRPTDVDETAEDENYLANPSYLMTTYYQSPRSVRLGFGVSF